MFLTRHPKSIYFIFIFFLLGQFTFTATRDRKEILHVVSNSAVLNQNAHTHTFLGNVTLNQGTTHLNGDTLLVLTNPHNEVSESIAFGNLAHFQTQPNHNTEKFHAVAESIHYFPPKNHVVLEGNAKAHLNQDSYAGPYIEYNTVTQVVVSPPTHGRTNIVIQPPTHSKS